MVDRATGTTNATPGSFVDIQFNCSEMWSFMQQLTYTRLCFEDAKRQKNVTLIPRPAPRARRIAATYARLYLETEDRATPSKKGRYYWMALAAFASKTVACSLDNWRTLAQGSFVTRSVTDTLTKGNLWLFMDIAPWHWYWSTSPDSFDMCKASRNPSTFVPQVKAAVAALPWSQEALPKIGNLRPSTYILKAFDLVKEIEALPADDKKFRPARQLEHLLAIADHEQRVILQPLIYSEPDFVYWLDAQRGWLSPIAPALELVFSSACSTSDDKLKSVAPQDTVLENIDSRMKWIGAAAKKFHGLMQGKSFPGSDSYMEAELATIAGWVHDT